MLRNTTIPMNTATNSTKTIAISKCKGKKLSISNAPTNSINVCNFAFQWSQNVENFINESIESIKKYADKTMKTYCQNGITTYVPGQDANSTTVIDVPDICLNMWIIEQFSSAKQAWNDCPSLRRCLSDYIDDTTNQNKCANEIVNIAKHYKNSIYVSNKPYDGPIADNTCTVISLKNKNDAFKIIYEENVNKK